MNSTKDILVYQEDFVQGSGSVNVWEWMLEKWQLPENTHCIALKYSDHETYDEPDPHRILPPFSKEVSTNA